MDQKIIKQLLDGYKRKGFSEGEGSTFLRLLENQENEKKINEYLYHELDTAITHKTDADKIDFRQLFRQIRYRITTGRSDRASMAIRMQNTAYRTAKIAAVLLIAFSIGGVASYWYFNRIATVAESFTEITTPMASTSDILLPDGSEVILNAGSKIRYSHIFNKSDRKINLVGEAFFKVSKNERFPFTVVTSHLDIKALGTEFNVKAYPDEKSIVATLVKGKIEILKNHPGHTPARSFILEPDQQAVFIIEQDKLALAAGTEAGESISNNPALQKDTMYVISDVDTKPAVVWTENKMIISKEPLGSLAVKLERKYDVVIRFADEEVKNFRFTGTLLDETIQQVLDAIILSSPIRYTIEGKTITLYENRKMKEKFRQHLKQY